MLLLVAYFLRTAHPARRTAVGREQYLFGAGTTPPTLLESPQGGMWLLVTEENTTSGILLTRWSALNIFLNAMSRFRWPNTELGPRSLTPFGRPASTYVLRGATLSRIWRYRTEQWVDSTHLTDGGVEISTTSILDLRTGRTYHGQSAWAILQQVRAVSWDVENVGSYYSDEEEATADTSALEGVPPGTEVESQEWRVGEQAFALGTLRTAAGVPSAVATTDGEAPQTLELAKNASPLALSHDGRTLFFLREGALWRLDLARPLPGLFLANPLPPLPEPPDETDSPSVR